MFQTQGNDGTLGRIARIREEFLMIQGVVAKLPYGQASHYGDAFNRLSGAFVAGDMTARAYGTNIGELIKDAEGAAEKEDRRKQAERRLYVQRAAARSMGRRRVDA